MTKIAIISQPEQGVLIDVGGCATVHEATQHLTCTLQVSSQFWAEQPVDLNLGKLVMTREELAQVLSTLAEVGVRPRCVFAQSASTKAGLRAHNIVPASGQPASLPITAEGGLATACGDTEAAADPTVSTTRPMAEVERETIPVEVVGTTRGVDPAVAPSAIAIVEEGASPNCQIPIAEEQATKPPVADGADSQIFPDAAPAAVPPEPAGEAVSAPPAAKQAPAHPHVLYLRQTLRSGQAISHKGHLVIIGDVNPGAEVIADGDITIWGSLRGVAHAGVNGNTECEIRALRFDPIQLRIAHAIARSPDRPRSASRASGPEIARVVNGTIRISASTFE